VDPFKLPDLRDGSIQDLSLVTPNFWWDGTEADSEDDSFLKRIEAEIERERFQVIGLYKKYGAAELRAVIEDLDESIEYYRNRGVVLDDEWEKSDSIRFVLGSLAEEYGGDSTLGEVYKHTPLSEEVSFETVGRGFIRAICSDLGFRIYLADATLDETINSESKRKAVIEEGMWSLECHGEYAQFRRDLIKGILSAHALGQIVDEVKFSSVQSSSSNPGERGVAIRTFAYLKALDASGAELDTLTFKVLNTELREVFPGFIRAERPLKNVKSRLLKGGGRSSVLAFYERLTTFVEKELQTYETDALDRAMGKARRYVSVRQSES